jgi:Purple acid Phosphatase, N-terminal domain
MHPIFRHSEKSNPSSEGDLRMKTIVSMLGAALLVSAAAVAQSTAGSSGSKSSSNTTAPNSTQSATTSSGVQAGNSGFDSDSSAPSAQTSTSSSAQSDSSYGTATQGSSDTQSIANGPVAETVSDSSALIGWATRNASRNTGVKYGTNRANLSQTAQGTDGADAKNHHAKLDGLSANTRYYFQVTENGQPVGGVGTFKTTASGEQPVQSKAVIPQK